MQFIIVAVLVVLFIASLCGNVWLIIGGLNAADRLEVLEDALTNRDEFIHIMRQRIIDTIDIFRTIDKEGYFEADDYVGDGFKALKDAAEALDNFLDKE